jgi:GDP-mannose 6-dehydrogenase
MINAGISPVVEVGMGELVARAVRAGRLRASLRTAEAMAGAQLSMICVGTPPRSDGRANLGHVLRAIEEVGEALRPGRRSHLLVLRSTVPPGTVESVVIPALEKSARRKVGRGLRVCFQPEFMREGTSVADFFHPPRTVIGANDAPSARTLTKLWQPVAAPLFVTSIRIAETIKYVDNAFHALKVSFANEIGSLCKSLAVDSHEVMRIFVEDRKLNLSPAYLRPGFAFGGPCLPKDLRALCALGREAHLQLPLLKGVLASNAQHLRRAVDLVLATGKRKIGILGLAFKAETDDLRESPACRLVQVLLRKGREVSVYDPQVKPERLVGANRDFIARQLPELPHLLVRSAAELIHSSEVLVLTSARPEFQRVLGQRKRAQILVDLVGLPFLQHARSTKVHTLCG